MSRTLVMLENCSARRESSSETTRPRRSDRTASASSATMSQVRRSRSPLAIHAPRVAGALGTDTSATTSSMISLPTYSVATGRTARTMRRSSVPDASVGLVCQTRARNGGRLRNAPHRSRSDRGGGSGTRPPGSNGGGIGSLAGHAPTNCNRQARARGQGGAGVSLVRVGRRPPTARRSHHTAPKDPL